MRNGRLRRPKEVANTLLREARKRATNKEILFDDGFKSQIIKELSLGICQATGTQMDVGGEIGVVSGYSPTLDRIIPHLGYVPGNVRVVCFAYNCMKGQEDDRFCELLASLFLLKRGWLLLSPENLKYVDIRSKVK